MASSQCSICLEPSIANVNSNIFGMDAAIWNPDRWLQDASVAAPLKSHMIAVSGSSHSRSALPPCYCPIVARIVLEPPCFLLLTLFLFQTTTSKIHFDHHNYHYICHQTFRSALPLAHSPRSALTTFTTITILTGQTPYESVYRVRTDMTQFGAGSNNCPGEELHYALLVKLLVQILPNINLDMASTVSSASGATPSFSDIRDKTVVKVNLPKVSGLQVPPSPLRATAPSFAPDTTTAPEYAPGLTPRKQHFSFGNPASTSLGGVGKYISALQSGTIFTPNTTETIQEAPSPTLSNASTAGADSITPEDKKMLGDLISRKTRDQLLDRFDPSQEITAQRPVYTWPMLSSRDRAIAHQAINRIWRGRLQTSTDRKTNKIRIFLKPDGNLATTPAARPAPIVRSAPVARPASAIHTAWGNFATTEGDRWDAAKAKDIADGKDHAAFAKQRITFEEALRERQEAAKNAPQAPVKQTFKLTGGAPTTNGKLGGPRRFVSVVETETDADGNIKVVNDNSSGDEKGGVTLPSADKSTARKVLPPHLRKRAAEAQAAQDGAVTTKPATDSTEGQTVERSLSPETKLWTAAMLPNPMA
jgi:hypothetical protein